jgi:Major Facilitator Superfamily
VLVGFRVIPRVPRKPVHWAHLDLAGALTSTAALLVLVYAVVEAPERGWSSLSTIGLLALSIVLTAVFVFIEQRHPQPLVRLGILRSASLLHANASAAVMLGFLPAGLIVVATAPRIGLLFERLRTPVMIMLGLLAFVTAYALFLRVDPSMSYVNFLLPTMLLLGIGFALCFPAVNAQATAGVADHEQGLASGLVNTSLQIGGAIVLAIVTAIVGNGGSRPTHDHRLLPHMTTALTVVVGVSVLGLLVTAARLRPRPRREPAVEAA